ncbi:MAG: tRNA 2-selenouridine synthase [Paraglaciecola sp.]|jgi:tRNA 2-selenouridine synthase
MTVEQQDLDIADFPNLFLNDTPLIDTRSPGEFAKGSFPGAVNLPLLTDPERAQVGTTYKQQGQAAAIELGHQLVTGEVKAARVQRWCEYVQQHPQARLFCWRGGLRSQLTQAWMLEAGVACPRIVGGYKALRHFLIEQSTVLSQTLPLLLLAGMTGSGKTSLLVKIPRNIDLEGLANHRGSSFGRRPDGQPSQIQFENALAVALLKLANASLEPVLIEDESSFVGACSLPLALFEQMQQSPRILLELPFASRIDNIIQDYVVDLHRDYCKVHPEQGFALFSDNLTTGLERLKKRLGNEKYLEIRQALEKALALQQQTGETDAHRQWISPLLLKYYDSSYDYQLAKQQQTILFKGNTEEVEAWLKHQ